MKKNCLVFVMVIIFSLSPSTSAFCQSVRGQETSHGLPNATEALQYLQTGKRYEDEEKYELAKEFYFRAAKSGNAEAQFLYSRRFTGKRHMEELRKAAQMGYVEAQYQYAIQADHEKLIQRGEQMQWLSLAGEAGHSDAQHRLAMFYLHEGVGRNDEQVIPQSKEKAFYWLSKLAEHGKNVPFRNRKTDAQARIGWMYLKGEGTNQDYAKAFHYLEQAAKDGNYGGYQGLATMYENGYFVEKNIKAAEEWRQKAKPVPVQY